jgi:hypothetical protein
MRWWSELKYVVKKLNRRRAERELQEEIDAGVYESGEPAAGSRVRAAQRSPFGWPAAPDVRGCCGSY